MPVDIVKLTPKDNVLQIPVVYNQNFENLKDAIEEIETIIDVQDSNVSVENVNVSRGSRALSAEILNVDGSVRVKGDITSEGTIKVSNVHVSNSAVINVVSGNLNMLGSNSNMNIEGSYTSEGVFALKNFGNSTMNGSNIGTYSNVASNVGTLSVTGKHSFILDFSNYSSSANVLNTNTVKEFKLPAPQKQGQIIHVVVNANDSTGKPHNLLSSNIVSLSSGQKISFQENYGVVTLAGSGNSWIILSMLKSNIV